MIGFIDNSFTITRNHNKWQELTIIDCLRLASFWLDYDWLHSGLISILIWSMTDFSYDRLELWLSWTTTDFILIWTASYIAISIQRNIRWSLVSTETCFVTSLFPRIYLYGNVFATRSLVMGLHVTIHNTASNINTWVTCVLKVHDNDIK
jgi:hypothetical protein